MKSRVHGTCVVDAGDAVGVADVVGATGATGAIDVVGVDGGLGRGELGLV